MASDLFEQRRAPGDQSGLRSAEQLIARETDDISASGNAFLWCRFVRQSPALRCQQAAAANIMNQREAVVMGQRRQPGQRRRFSEADDAEIAGMHRQQRRRLIGQRLLEVAQAGAVRRAHLDQPRAALPQYIGDAESTANLNQFPPRDDHLFTGGQRRQHEHYGGGIVVNGKRILCAGQRA